jgi:GalNAc-alpha-(1->4)-GalNAc-alpha-(1->3)-diNAcBac-PP-undecaprenol alpha-1,4-N-acetyl-D-galactosaminyltransferase
MNKKICLVSPSLKMGGIERELVVLANFFAGEGYKVIFISCLRGERFYNLHSEIKVVEPVFGHKGGNWRGLIFYPRLSLFIRNQIKKFQPDAVLTLGDWFNPMVLLALWGTNYSVFIRDSTSPDYKFKFPIPLMKRWLYPRSAGFIAQTERTAEYNRKHFGQKLNIRVIPNAIKQVKAFPEINREKIILYVGRFAWEKAPERLIRAYAALEDRQGWTLLMAGSGPLLKPMQALAKQLNLEDQMVFPGKVENVDLLYSRGGHLCYTLGVGRFSQLALRSHGCRPSSGLLRQHPMGGDSGTGKKWPGGQKQ